MELSSHVTANLDQWVENGFINASQREAIAQLMEEAVEDAHDSGYDEGHDHGYNAGLSDASDDSFDQGYASALADNNIEECNNNGYFFSTRRRTGF